MSSGSSPLTVMRSSMWGFLMFAGCAWLAISWSVLRLEPTNVADVAAPVVMFAALCEIVRALVGSRTWWLNAGMAALFMTTAVVLLTAQDSSFTTPASLIGWFLLVRGAVDVAVATINRATERTWGLLMTVGVLQAALGFFSASPFARTGELLIVTIGAAGLLRAVVDLVTALRLREIHSVRQEVLQLPPERAAGVAGYSAGLTDYENLPASARHRATAPTGMGSASAGPGFYPGPVGVNPRLLNSVGEPAAAGEPLIGTQPAGEQPVRVDPTRGANPSADPAIAAHLANWGSTPSDFATGPSGFAARPADFAAGPADFAAGPGGDQREYPAAQDSAGYGLSRYLTAPDRQGFEPVGPTYFAGPVGGQDPGDGQGFRSAPGDGQGYGTRGQAVAGLDADRGGLGTQGREPGGQVAGFSGHGVAPSFHDEVVRTTADLDQMIAQAGVTGIGAAAHRVPEDLPSAPADAAAITDRPQGGPAGRYPDG